MARRAKEVHPVRNWIAFAVPNGQVVIEDDIILLGVEVVSSALTTRSMMLWSLLLSGDTIEYASLMSLK